MSTSVSSMVVAEGLADVVAAGPAAAVSRVDAAVRAGVLGRLAGGEAVVRALERADHGFVRDRTLTGPVTMLSVLGACLFSGQGYASVLATVFSVLARLVPPGTVVPDASAFSQARARLGEDAMRLLFEQTAADAPPLAAGSTAFGMEMTAFDGTTLELFADEALITEFGVPSGGSNPLVRMVTLVSCGTRRTRAAVFGAYTTGEQELVDQLAGALGPGQLNLADRNFFSMDRWIRFAATGVHLLWRVKNGSKSLPAKIMKYLPDGSALVRLRESDGMRARRRRAAGDYTLPRLPETIARMVEFDLVGVDETGRGKKSRLRLLTTLLDHEAFPADQIAQVYAERWQVELSYLRLKKTLRGAGTVLRGRSVALVRQEIWAFLIVYNALCDLAAEAAALDGIDPDEISFVAVLRLARSAVAADVSCRHCGNRPNTTSGQLNDLLYDILAHPRNRADRQRTGPRTATERRTGHTRNVKYNIETVTSNLPKAA